MADIIIDIASEFTGKSAFSKAEKSTFNLEKSVKKLAKTFGIAYSAQQVLAYGKASIKAAAADQKAQQQLALALKNVGLERDAASSETYIQSLQSQFGIVDDKLRPAYQTLAVATRDTTEAQKLLNLSLDISASTGKDLDSVTAALSKAYLGNNTSLSKLGVGISKADLKAKSFNDIVDQLSVTFAGAATSAANTFAGQMDRLAVSSNNAKEIIGTGLIDALTQVGGNNSIADLGKQMESVATFTADAIRGVGILVSTIKNIPGVGKIFDFLVKASPIGMLADLGKQARQKKEIAAAQQGAPAELTALSKYSIVQNKVVKNAQTLTKLSAQQIKDLKLKTAIEKANLALGKGNEIFNMDAIELNAALINQTEQLGKATTSTQVLAIANDIARLKVKQDILALEDAIASGDEKAITAATDKLNADMKILGALQQQNVKLLDIKSLLESLKPKDLINITNLEEALRLLGLINLSSTGSKTIPSGTTPTSPVSPVSPLSPSSMPPADTYAGFKIKEATDAVTYFGQAVTDAFQSIDDSGAFNALVNAYAGGAINPFNAGSFRAAEGGSLFNSGAVGSRDINITIQANTIANPDELTGLIQDTIIRLNKQGDYLTTAGAL